MSDNDLSQPPSAPDRTDPFDVLQHVMKRWPYLAPEVLKEQVGYATDLLRQHREALASVGTRDLMEHTGRLEASVRGCMSLLEVKNAAISACLMEMSRNGDSAAVRKLAVAARELMP